MVYFHLIHNYLIKWFTVIILCSITYIKHIASITNTGIICNENFPELETICLSLKIKKNLHSDYRLFLLIYQYTLKLFLKSLLNDLQHIINV